MTIGESKPHPSTREDLRSQRLMRLFREIFCPRCGKGTIVSYIQNKVRCDGCKIILRRPTGINRRLSKGPSYRKTH